MLTATEKHIFVYVDANEICILLPAIYLNLFIMGLITTRTSKVINEEMLKEYTRICKQLTELKAQKARLENKWIALQNKK